MSVLEDTDATTPANIFEALNCRVAALGNAWQEYSLPYTPRNTGWLFTRDGGLSDDRFEMPGDFVFSTQGYTTAITPGLLYVDYDLEFNGIVTTNVSLALPSLTREQKRQYQMKQIQQVLSLEEEDPVRQEVGLRHGQNVGSSTPAPAWLGPGNMTKNPLR